MFRRSICVVPKNNWPPIAGLAPVTVTRRVTGSCQPWEVMVRGLPSTMADQTALGGVRPVSIDQGDGGVKTTSTRWGVAGATTDAEAMTGLGGTDAVVAKVSGQAAISPHYPSFAHEDLRFGYGPGTCEGLGGRERSGDVTL